MAHTVHTIRFESIHSCRFKFAWRPRWKSVSELCRVLTPSFDFRFSLFQRVSKRDCRPLNPAKNKAQQQPIKSPRHPGASHTLQQLVRLPSTVCLSPVYAQLVIFGIRVYRFRGGNRILRIFLRFFAKSNLAEFESCENRKKKTKHGTTRIPVFYEGRIQHLLSFGRQSVN